MLKMKPNVCCAGNLNNRPQTKDTCFKWESVTYIVIETRNTKWYPNYAEPPE